MALVKLGPHIQRTTRPAEDWARAAAIVKTVDNLYPLVIARDDAITIFRHCFQEAPGMPCNRQDLYREGREVAWEIASALEGFVPTYVEIYNEVGERLGQGLERHVALTRVATDRLHAMGYRVAGFGFTSGLPGPDEWRHLQREGYAGVDALGLHQYWPPHGFSPEHSFRHRWMHEWTGGQHPPVLITECGMGDPGWRGVMSPADYAEQLREYDRELQRDAYVLGATVFTAGAYPNWASFDIDDAIPLLVSGAGGGRLLPWGWVALGAAALGAGYVAYRASEVEEG